MIRDKTFLPCLSFLLIVLGWNCEIDQGTSMIVGSHLKASIKDGARNFWQNFKNASKQMLTIFSKILRPKNFSTGPILILGTRL